MNTTLHERAKRVFLDAIERPGGERQAFLDQACVGDAELRREVESLLAHHTTQTLLAQPAAADTVNRATEPGPTLPASFRPGRREALGLSRLGPTGWLAIGSLATLLALTLATAWLYFYVRHSVKSALADRLTAFAETQARAVQNWLQSERRQVESWARQHDVSQPLVELASLDPRQNDLDQALAGAPAQAALRAALRELAGPHVRYLAWNRSGMQIADWTDDGRHLGSPVSETGGALLARVFRGESLIRTPYLQDTIGSTGPVETGLPSMAVLVPIRNPAGQVVAALTVRGIGTETEFYDILSLGRAGQSGETYAVDRSGLLISPCRFADQLVKLGLVQPRAVAPGVLEVPIRDPGGNLLAGYRPTTPPGARPLTRMAALGLDGHDGHDVEGYRDYRGVVVVGAWKWIPDPGFVLAVEIDRSEALATLNYLRAGFGGVFGLTLLAGGVAAISWLRLRRVQTQLGETRQVGPYLLEDKIGAGGMGEVYRAQHALLKRPTALKFIRPQLANSAMLDRFEREVRLAAQLTHPSTIEIYDYGHTPEGVFYYAMELVEGPNLAECVGRWGPLPEARVVYLLHQLCGALAEAHGQGLVHRDIKPHNIMLCQRGGMFDFVKLLDFGLARPMEPDADGTHSSLLAGTPAYMAPEQIRDARRIDARSDLYALGAVAFFLLVGRHAFGGGQALALLDQSLHTPPPRPTVEGAQVSPQLDDLVVCLLDKNPNHRPQTAAELGRRLTELPCWEQWGPDQAQDWWTQHPR